MPEITRARNGKPAVTIYHNPRCNTSRTVLGMLRAKGLEPEIVEYLKTPLSRAELKRMIERMGVAPRDVVRKSEAPYKDRKLDTASDAQLLDAMAEEPILMNRPIVVTAKGTRLCRPADAVNDLLS